LKPMTPAQTRALVTELHPVRLTIQMRTWVPPGVLMYDGVTGYVCRRTYDTFAAWLGGA